MRRCRVCRKFKVYELQYLRQYLGECEKTCPTHDVGEHPGIHRPIRLSRPALEKSTDHD